MKDKPGILLDVASGNRAFLVCLFVCTQLNVNLLFECFNVEADLG